MVGEPVHSMLSQGNSSLEYEGKLKRFLLKLLDGRNLSFTHALRLAGGAYPTDVRDALRSMVATGTVVQENGSYSVASPAQSMSFSRTGVDDLGITTETDAIKHINLADPHPADYDWRFTSAALRNLLVHLGPFIGKGASIALLGTTTLFPQISGGHAKVVLFDRSPSLLRDLQTGGFANGLVEHVNRQGLYTTHRHEH